MTAQPRIGARLSAIERAVLETMAYSDVFDYPLTAEEIRRALPSELSLIDLEGALSRLGGCLTHVTPYYMLTGREALVETRRRRAEASRRLMRRAHSYGRLIGRLPFVRMVAVSGSLAVDNAEDGDDIDYLIVTAPGRVWLARALTMIVVRLARLRGLTLCPNYLLAETALTLADRDFYTARELLQMRPVSGFGVYERMLHANTWAFHVLPNWETSAHGRDEERGLIQRIGESVLGGRYGDVLERALLRRKARELQAQAGNGDETRFDATVCKGHFDAHRARLEAALADRLDRLEATP